MQGEQSVCVCVRVCRCCTSACLCALGHREQLAKGGSQETLTQGTDPASSLVVGRGTEQRGHQDCLVLPGTAALRKPPLYLSAASNPPHPSIPCTLRCAELHGAPGLTLRASHPGTLHLSGSQEPEGTTNPCTKSGGQEGARVATIHRLPADTASPKLKI